MSGAFSISQADKRPMYLQIMEQIKQRIAVGDWTEGQSIPSIRQLAVDLEVSVITVKRAYLELEREGIIVTQHGKGSHVASTPGLGARLREQELDQHLEQATRIAALLGLRPKELEHRLREAGERFSSEGVTEKETI
jgi:GntR family transcriptional regulator